MFKKDIMNPPPNWVLMHRGAVGKFRLNLGWFADLGELAPWGKQSQPHICFCYKCKAIWMWLSYAAISQGRGNLLPLAPRRPPRRFNVAEVLADYRHLSGAVMGNAAPAGGEQGAGTLIRTAALGRFPQGDWWDGTGDGGWTSGENSRPGLMAEHRLVFKSLIIW